MNLADWLNDFCILIVKNNFWFDGKSTLYLWHLNAGGPLQLYLAVDSKIGFFLYIDKFCRWFLLETYLNKNWYLFYCTNLIFGELSFLSYSWKGFQHIYSDGTTGSHWFFAYRQIARRGKKFNQILIGCCSQRLLKGCSVTENSIEWKIRWIEEIFHAFWNHNLSQQILLSNQIVVFNFQARIFFKDFSFSCVMYLFIISQMIIPCQVFPRPEIILKVFWNPKCLCHKLV